MAIIGHWLFAFPVCCLVPQASVALICKCTMLSDVLCGVFLLLGIESLAIFTQWMSTPPPGTLELIGQWKAGGRWEEGVDLAPGEQGFRGFNLLFPVYVNLSWSHSCELMAIISIALIAFLRLRYCISAGYALGIFVAMTSHPLLDMVFHDAYFLMGDRSKTCIHGSLWQIPYNGPFTFTLEIAMAYIPYRAWRSMRVQVDGDEGTAKKISKYERQFWTLAITHNMASYYLMVPLMSVGFYKYAPQLQFLTPNAYWSYILFFLTCVSWSGALYPLHMLEQLTKPGGPVQDAEPLLDSVGAP